MGIPAPSSGEQPLRGVTGRVWFSQRNAHTQDLEGRYGTLPFRVTARVDEPLALAHAMNSPPRQGARVAHVQFDMSTGPVDADALFPAGGKLEHPPALIADGIFRTPRLKSQRLDVTGVTASAHYDRGVVHLDGATAKGYQGDLTASGEFDFRAPARPGYGIRVQATQLDAPAVMAAWIPSLKNLLTGRFDVNTSVSGAGFGTKEALAHLDLDALAKSADGRLAGSELLQAAAKWTGLADLRSIEFKELLWHLIVKDGRVLFRDVIMHGADSDYALSGSIGLNGDIGLAVAMAIPATKLSLLSPALRTAAQTLADNRGRVLLDFAVRGTIQHPTFSLQTDRIGAAMASRLRDELLGKAMDPIAKALGDSLSGSKTKIEDKLAAVAESQKRALESQTQEQAQGVKNLAHGWLEGILHPQAGADSTASRPPPPAMPAAGDTAKSPADTTRHP